VESTIAEDEEVDGVAEHGHAVDGFMGGVKGDSDRGKKKKKKKKKKENKKKKEKKKKKTLQGGAKEKRLAAKGEWTPITKKLRLENTRLVSTKKKN